MDNKQIAETIYKQLGGNKFKAMTGAYNFVFGDSDGKVFLQCRFKGSRKANLLEVIYDYVRDAYTMRFKKVGNAPKFNLIDVATYDDVYCESLQDLFTSVTGLYTKL